MSAIRGVIVFWASLYLVLGLFRGAKDGDLWWQRWLGDLILRTHRLPLQLGPETFTSSGAPWVPHEWAFSILVAIARDHGALWMLALLVSAVPTVVLCSIYLRARNKALPEGIAIMLFLSGFAMAQSFGIRDQVVGWGCFALFWLALERDDRWFYATLPIILIWANLHASVMIAPAILLARIAGLVLEGGIGALRASRELRAFPLALLATICTPLGLHLPAYAISFVTSPVLHLVEEERRVRLSDISFTLGSLPIALALLLPKPRDLLKNWAESLPLLLIFVAMILVVRNIPLFAIAAAPYAARNLGLNFPQLQKVGSRLRELEPVATIALAVMIPLSAVLLASELRRQPPVLPIDAVSSLGADRDSHRVFCENFAWCSVALQFPNLSVFVDGRLDPYPTDVWKSYLSAVEVQPSWRQQLSRYGVDAVVAARHSELAERLARDPAWHRSFRDARYAVYLREVHQ
jgi:hypothetical protein